MAPSDVQVTDQSHCEAFRKNLHTSIVYLAVVETESYYLSVLSHDACDEIRHAHFRLDTQLAIA